MPISIKDKVVVVTGGAGEIGAALSQRLVEEGAAVLMADIADGREEAARIKKIKRGNKVAFVKADVTKEKDMAKMADTALKKFGRIEPVMNANLAALKAGPSLRTTKRTAKGSGDRRVTERPTPHRCSSPSPASDSLWS